MAGRDTGEDRDASSNQFAFCDAHLVENCRLCRLADLHSDRLAEELSARLKECLQNLGLADVEYGSTSQHSVPPGDRAIAADPHAVSDNERGGGVERPLPLHSTLAVANYEHVPPELLVNLQAINKGAVTGHRGDNSTDTHSGARPRASVRRSHTTPDSLLHRPVGRAVSQPPSPEPATCEEENGARARKSSSVRRSFDSFLKSTRRRFQSRSRRVQSASTTPTEGDQQVIPGSMVISPRVPALAPFEDLHAGQASALPSRHLVTAAQAPLYEDNSRATNIPLVIPVMNMGPDHTTRTSREVGLVEGASGPHLRVHTTVDYLHYLVPGLTKVTNCGFYWGVMDRYEAEALLENKPEGTFLLRDSSQDDFIFSVSFRRYGRSLHARVEQWKHRFSFDAHDNGVFKADSVTALLEHYKDPQTCMFFEPMLTLPLNRPQPFSLLHLARAVVCDNITYDSIDSLLIPKHLQHYLRYYHYKQKIRVRTGAGWVMLRPNPAF